jgi:hypothetical protein
MQPRNFGPFTMSFMACEENDNSVDDVLKMLLELLKKQNGI